MIDNRALRPSTSSHRYFSRSLVLSSCDSNHTADSTTAFRRDVMRRWLALMVSCVVVGSLAAGCGGGGGGGGSGDGQAAVLVTDAPANDFSSLALTLSEVTLVDAAGRETPDLLAAPVRL